MEYFGEQGYLDLIRYVMDYGVDIPDRTGVGTRAIFDAKVIFDVGKEFPFSTSRIAGLRPAFEEFKLFWSGETQTKKLEEKGVYFWVGNTTRDFLDRRGLTHLEEGDMGKAYGKQWRRFGKTEFDQLKEIYETLKTNPYSRRMYTTFWNPEESAEMALTPCWHSHQFVVLPDGEGNNVLHIKLLNRSLDSVFGFLFAIQQYSFMLVAFAKMFGFKVGRLSADLTHVHIYQNQFEYAREVVDRELGTPGKLIIKKELNDLEDFLSLEWEDIECPGLAVNKTPFTAERPPMAAG